MGFFSDFSTWLDAILVTYIANNTARLAALIEPAVVTLAVFYVVIWGYLQLAGKIEEPFLTGVKRIVTLAVILGVALRLWLYNELIVNTFFEAPAALAAGVIGARDSVGTADAIFLRGADAAALLIQKGGIFDGDFSFYIAGFGIYFVVGVTMIYTLFLLTLSRIALSVLLALGPLFIALLMFDSSKRFFEAWLAQLTNYAFVTILTVLVAALMLNVVGAAAEQAASAGGGITISDAVHVCLAAGLTFLVMRQVLSISAGLASGLALSTFGVMSAAVAWGLGGATRKIGQFARGLSDSQTTRWDSPSRKAGYYTRRGLTAGARGLGRGWRDNALRRR
jgi:type IV secretion system protein VirB6